jgi:putative two-component system response regulator
VSDAKPTILAIDDAENVRRLLEVTLGKSQVVKTAPDAHSALAWAQLAPPPELVLLDTEPAGMSGYELCKALRAMPGFAEVPVIFLAERPDPQGLVQGFQLGALDFLMKPLAAPVLLLRIRGHLTSLARERAAGLQGAELRITRLVRAMHAHERSLGGNRAQRLAQYARSLALAAGAREVAANLLGKAAPVHDVGKLAVPPELLRNERALAGAEREQFERHAALGAEIIGEHEDVLLKLARTLALTHHEHWDGSGYPGGLQGSQIPWAGRVMAIVDAFESMTAPQHGGSRVSTEGAVAEITAGAGLLFDPALAEALRKAVAVFRKIHGAYPERAPDGGEDLVIGTSSVPAAAAKAGQPAAPDDDIVIGTPGPARDPADDAGLTMMGPLRLGAGAASSDKIREAIQRAAAKAQGSQEARREKVQEPPPAPLPEPSVPVLDLELGESAPPPAAAEPDELKRAQETLAQAQEDRAAAGAALAQARTEAQVRMNELEATWAALAEARAELEALRARVSELEAERAGAQAALAQARAELDSLNARINSQSQTERQLQEARGEAQIRMNELEAAKAALTQAHAELDRLNARINSQSQTERQLQEARGEAQIRTNELEATKAALAKAQGELERVRAQPVAPAAETRGELEALRARVEPVVDAELQARTNELEATKAALAKAQGELGRRRAQPVAPPAELHALNTRVATLVSERARSEAALGEARAEIANLRASARQLESQIAGAEAARSQAHGELERARVELVELRSRPVPSVAPQSQAEIAGLRNRIDELESERAAAAALLSEARAERDQGRRDDVAAHAEAEASLTLLQARVADAQAAASVPDAPRPMATRLLVAFLFGALAMGGVIVLLLHR